MIPEPATLMAACGFRLVPIGPGQKHPPIDRWQELATSESAVLEGWWGPHPEWGVGWKMGAQDDGRWLFAIDVDVNKGGRESFRVLIAEFGLEAEFKATTTARTGGGGWHFVFELPRGYPFQPTNRSKLNGRAGIDVRAENGQIVVEPSLHPETGLAYAWEEGKAPWELPPQVASGQLMRMLSKLQAPPTPLRLVTEARWHPSMEEPDSPADWVHAHLDFFTYLMKHGWVHLGGESWRRPGKTDRGSSAQLKNNGLGPLNVFTTDIPIELERLGTLDPTGQCMSVTLFSFISAYEFGGDMGACASWVRRTYMSPVGGLPGRRVSAAPNGDVTPGDAGVPCPLFLDAQWYQQRPWMSACLQMAQAVGGSPSAHLLAFLTRWATLIPPGYSIPPINGAPSSFDLLCVIAGTSGSGKTSPMHNAEDLLPVQRSDLRMGLGLGSGEGIIEAFYGMQEIEDDKGKKHKERRRMIAGVNFAISEGLIFAELAGRGGTTHVTRLCDAWSGASLSTANASAETFRHIERGQYRLTLMMGIQADMAHQLMNDSAAAQGFVGRLLFCWAEEPRVTPRPQPPDSLVLPVPPKIASPSTRELPEQFSRTFLEYPEHVYAEIQGASDARVGTKVPVEEHHHDLMRCKVAGIMALMEGRTSVSVDDWSLATDLCNVSRAVRLYLYEHRRQQQRDIRYASAEARADTEIIVESVKDRQGIARMAEAIQRKIQDGPLGRNRLCRAVSSGSTRHRFDRALDLAVANGWVRVVEDRIEPA